MFQSRGRLIGLTASASAMMCCLSSAALAGDFDGTPGERMAGLLAGLERRLPQEPRWSPELRWSPEMREPRGGGACATLRAGLASSAFASPSATDPDIDSMAAVAANPASSNPDTVRIQSALNACHAGGFVRLAM